VWFWSSNFEESVNLDKIFHFYTSDGTRGCSIVFCTEGYNSNRTDGSKSDIVFKYDSEERRNADFERLQKEMKQ